MRRKKLNFLFADDTIVYLENDEESTNKRILEVISEYIARSQNTNYYTGNEQLVFENKQTVTF